MPTTTPLHRPRTGAVLALGLLLTGAVSGCSIRSMAVNALAESMSRSSVVYARDDDPELVAEALPFLLKTVEGLLLEAPKNKELLITACSGFTSYAQAFVAIPADYIEENDLDESRHQRDRASRLFVRGREFGMRALELSHPGLTERLILDPGAALAETGVEDVPALFWTGAAWAGAINTAKDDMDLVADLAVANSLLQRALVLDPDWNDGSIHEVLIALEAARSGGNGGSIERAREHFAEAVRLGDGKIAGPYVTLAESVSIKEQKLGEFQELLAAALAVDPEAAPDQRLANVLSRKRAAWLKEHTEDFFIDYEPEEEDAP